MGNTLIAVDLIEHRKRFIGNSNYGQLQGDLL